MIIPQPKVEPEEIVLVKNYRRKDILEKGVVASLKYEYIWGSWSWTYDVTLLRKSKSGNSIRLYVGNNRIKRIQKERKR